MNTDAPWPTSTRRLARVLGIQAKLHRWATDDPIAGSTICSTSSVIPAFLVVAWDRVRSNKGHARPGWTGRNRRSIDGRAGSRFLAELRDDLKARTFVPLPVRERLIPKSGGKLRRLGIPTVRDRVVQAALKLVLEPIFEADFQPCSYGFRPRRRAQDAIAEIHFFASRSYEWVLEADITACFDEIDHAALMGRVRRRIGDKRVLALVKAFLKAGHPQRGPASSGTRSPAPRRAGSSHRCWPTSPCPCSTSTSPGVAGDGHDRDQRHGVAATGSPTYRLVRYADDFVVLVSGNPGARRGAARRGRDGASPDGAAAVGGEDEDRPHRRGLRLPRVPHPAAPEARHGQAVRLHLPVEEGARLDRRRRCGRSPDGIATDPRRPAAPAQPGAAGLGHYFRHGVAKRDLRLPAPLHLAPGRRLAAPQAPRASWKRPPAALPARTGGRRDGDARCSTRPR